MNAVLSICIPTFNRGEILDQALTHLINLPVFTEFKNWDVAISDNASSDATQIICKRFESRYPDRIHYFRNAKNVRDENFRIALSRGKGIYLKLCNDTLLLTDNGIREMLNCIIRNLDKKPNLYFRNVDTNFPAQTCQTFNEFIESVGCMCTWIAEFGIWRDDFNNISDFSRESERMLIQVDATFRMVASKSNAVVLKRHFFDLIPKPVNKGYEPSKIFGQNYFSILSPYADAGMVSYRTLNLDKWRMFRYVILPNYLITSPKFQFTRSDYLRNLWPQYKSRWYFYAFFPLVILAIPIAWMRKTVFNH